MISTSFSRKSLSIGISSVALLVGLSAGPAFAQAASTSQPSSATPVAPGTAEGQATNDQAADVGQDVVVTGSILSTATLTPSPVTTVTAESLDKRGISTTQDAIQQLASNNGPALTNSFTANGAFAGGASAVSLRGLSTNSTLVLFDGLRAAYYPLADDGSRNFVDLNTIPDDIIDRIEVLRDGASSSYGADAIAGVVNIITKKQFKGITGRAEAGISQQGDAASKRLSLTAGYGDLNENGFNAYISGFYYESDALRNSERRYPYNSSDNSRICYNGTCGPDGRLNGLSGGLLNGVSTNAQLAVRPYNATNTTATAATYTNLAPNCLDGTRYNVGAADRAIAANATAPNFVCQIDVDNEYSFITPKIERYGASARVTARLPGEFEGYAEFNFIQNTSSYNGIPATIRGNAPAGFYFPRYSTSANVATYDTAAMPTTILTLPIYVCPQRVNCTAANGTLNPQNPFAAAGQVARLIGRLPNIVEYNQTRNRAYRGAIGIRGDITSNITLDVQATAMHSDLQRVETGYVYIQHLLDVIADGTYNFANPFLNTQAQNDYLAPRNQSTATSDLDQINATLSAKLLDLPGGPLQLGVGGSVRYEAVDAPSINSDLAGPTQRYFRLNAFATTGHRTVYSGYAELDAPIVDQVDINLSGRYDKYSTGPDYFSPKAGVKFSPIRQVTLRGTYSKGFRIPSFGEANATFPTTGYVTASRGIYSDAYLAQYGCSLATYTTRCPAYITGATIGETTLANQNLQPEKSRSFTGGVVVNPIRNISITVDYYNIRKTNAITGPNLAPAIAAYYNNTAIPAGYTVIPDAADVNNPNAKPRIAFVQAPFLNANTIKSEGLDFSANGTFEFGKFKISTNLDASYILRLETSFPDGTVERYDGTLGNFNLTAGSGTPKWHGTWLNSVQYGPFQLNGTVNYFGGYNLSAQDQGTGYKDCGLSDGSIPCDVKSYVTFDLNGQIKVNDRFTIYGTMLNVFNRYPPVDDVTYGAVNYNPVQGGVGILGRYLKAGVKVNF